MASLHQEFAPKLKALQEVLRSQYGIETAIGSGGRSMEEQARLYAQGRTRPGPVVTNAPPGSSYHNYGAAVDLRPAGGASEIQLERAMRDIFSTRANQGLAPGLTWGGTFKNLYDPLHVQLGTSLAQLRGSTGAQAASPLSPPVGVASGTTAAGSPASTKGLANLPSVSLLVPQMPAVPAPVSFGSMELPQVPVSQLLAMYGRGRA